MKYLGLDIGSKTIGVAFGHGVISFSKTTIVFRQYQFNYGLKLLLEIIKVEKPETIVVGHPISMDGTKSSTTIMVEDFVEKLKQETTIPIILWDERLTTKTAQQTLISADVSRAKRKIHKDKLAAQLILQNYFDYLENSKHQ